MKPFAFAAEGQRGRGRSDESHLAPLRSLLLRLSAVKPNDPQSICHCCVVSERGIAGMMRVGICALSPGAGRRSVSIDSPAVQTSAARRVGVRVGVGGGTLFWRRTPERLLPLSQSFCRGLKLGWKRRVAKFHLFGRTHFDPPSDESSIGDTVFLRPPPAARLRPRTRGSWRNSLIACAQRVRRRMDVGDYEEASCIRPVSETLA